MEIIAMNNGITPYAIVCDPLETGGCGLNCSPFCNPVTCPTNNVCNPICGSFCSPIF